MRLILIGGGETVGGGTGSTAGGIKQYRIHVLYRGLVWEFRRRLMPHIAVTEPDYWRGEERRSISDGTLRQVALFVFLYVAVFFLGGSMLAACGYPMQDSVSEFASALSTVGVSVGVTSPDAPLLVLWVEMGAMIVGRLEFFTLMVGLVKLLTDMPVVLPRALNLR